MKQTPRLLAFMFLVAMLPIPASAQMPALTAAQTAQAAAPAAPAAPKLTPAEAQAALDVLQDPQKRDQLIAVLKTIATAAPVTGAVATPPAQEGKKNTQVTLKPNGLGAQLLVALSHWSSRLTGEAVAMVHAMTNLPQLWRWLAGAAHDPSAVTAALVAIAWLAGIMATALALEAFCALALRRLRTALTQRLPPGDGEYTRLLRILPYAIVRLILDLVPVAVFAAFGNFIAAIIPVLGNDTRLVVLAIVNAYAACRAVMCVVRVIVSPDDRRLRLWRLGDADARFVVAWSRRIVVIAVFGDALIGVALLLGLDQSAHDGLQRLVLLILAVLLVVVVIRSRQAVAASIRTLRPGAETARWRAWLAEAWPYLAVITIVTGWIGLASGSGAGVTALYFPGVTLGVVIGARLALIIVLAGIERLLRLDPDTEGRFLGLNQRAARYRQPLEYLAETVIALLAAVVLLQLWGAPAFAWFAEGSIGHRLVSALITIAIAVIAATAVWEVTHALLERHLTRLGEDAGKGAARLMTLLPILRTAFLTAILTIIGLTALSEIGVNIAPLLAGAGIVGIAVGFGSQHLVQDVITGIFVLFENAIQIGDGVTVAGLSGSIEQLSVRTIRLRAGDGSVHIIPFSSVTTITNSNRGIGNAAVSVTVAAAEDTDRVAEVLVEIAAGMRAEADFAARMLGELQLFGVDAIRPWGATITGQIVCTDSGRWPVQREFNRRVKKRFEELDIALAAPPNAAA